jgi:hypothetical protein
VPRLVAQDPAGLVDAQQRLVLAELAAHLDLGEDLGHQLGARAAHHRVGVRDDEDVGPGGVVLEAQPHGLRPVAGVDVSPEVPPAQVRVAVEVREPMVVLRVHDVGEPQPDHLEPRVPAAELARHLLLERLAQRVGRLRARVVLLVDRHVRRRGVERQAEHRLAAGPDDVADAGRPARREDVVGRGHVVGERGRVGHQARGPDRGKVHDRVHGAVLVDATGQRGKDLAVVGEVDGQELSLALRVAAVDGQDVPAGLTQVAHDGTAELACCSGDGDAPRLVGGVGRHGPILAARCARGAPSADAATFGRRFREGAKLRHQERGWANLAPGAPRRSGPQMRVCRPLG